jgi:hypothetical protein
MSDQVNYEQEKEDFKQQLLEGVLKDFSEKLKSVATDAISEVETQYLPHVLGDTESNIDQ